jgi:tol-pal system-associated acyl-CoA thioesterase
VSRIAPRLPWPPDFPDVIVQRSPDSAVRMKDQPGYMAAKKSADPDAAFAVVTALIDPARLDDLRAIIGDRKPTLVAVHADEDGTNALPAAYAAILGIRLGLPVDEEIVQINRTYRTGSDSLHRLLTRAEFEGPVRPGQTYVIVDDVVTQGGTLADLRSYIDGRGGTVLAATTLVGSGGSHLLALRLATLDALRAGYGAVEPAYQGAFGHGYEGLTESEARAVQRFGSVDAFRDRVIAAAEARHRASGSGNGGGETCSAGNPEHALSPTVHRFHARVYYEDTDAGGVVYHANYLKLAERARTEAMRALGAPHAELLRLHGLMFMVRRAKLDYLRPARLDDSLVVVSRSLAVGAASVELRQAICLEHATDRALVVVDIQLACVRLADMRAARIPPRWRDALSALAADEL